MIIHKGKKMNYVCTINPTKIRNITGKVTDLKNKPAFPKKLSYIKIVPSQLNFAIKEGVDISASGLHGNNFTGKVAVQMRHDSEHLYFTEIEGNILIQTFPFLFIFLLIA